MKIAFFANNQFLLMTAVNLKCTIFLADEVHVYTTFKFSNAIFEKVFFIKDIGVIEESILDLTEQMKAAYAGSDDFLRVSKGIIETYGENPANFQYDMIIAMGYTYFPFWLAAINRKNGIDTKLVRISDGVVFKYSDINYHFDKAFKEVNNETSFIENGFQAEMLYNAHLCPKKKHEIIKIPQISKCEKNIIVQMDLLSGFTASINKVARYKYIFFTSSTINGVNFFVNETEIIQRIVYKFGADKVIICPHPWRDVSDLLGMGLEISKFRWAAEFLYPHIDLEEKVFISVGTNAVYTPFEVFGIHPQRVYFLDNIMEENKCFYENRKFDYVYYTSLHQRMRYDYKKNFKDIYFDDGIEERMC